MELDDNVLRELMLTFQTEAVDYVKTINQSLLQMERAENDAQRQEQVQAAMRAAHTMKGAARAVNLLTVEAITHHLEAVLQAGRKDLRVLNAAACDTPYTALDMIERLIVGAEVAIEPIL